MIEESSHRQACDALHRAIIDRDKLEGELAAARAETDRLKVLIREVLDADKGTIDPPTVRELEDIIAMNREDR